MTNRNYHEARFSPDARREVLWSSLWKYYFSRLISAHDRVLDLGCGYGNFINQVQAGERIAIDSWPGFPQHLSPGVKVHVRDVTDIGFLEEGSIDFAFASNLFEHLPRRDFQDFLEKFRTKLSARGTLNILQPNYRYCYREYFDDFTHQSVYSHVSLCDLLTASGYDILECRPRFLPLTIKSRMPVRPWLIRLYLALPFKPLGKQMLVRARPRR